MPALLRRCDLARVASPSLPRPVFWSSPGRLPVHSRRKYFYLLCALSIRTKWSALGTAIFKGRLRGLRRKAAVFG